MSSGDTMYAKGYSDNVNNMSPTDKKGVEKWLANGRDGNVNNISIIIDGYEAMDKRIQQSNYEAMINLGTF